MNDNFLLFSNFIVRLKRQGFVIGVDHYMRLHAVMREFASQRKPEQLKSLLYPIFTTSKKEQHLFSQLLL